MISSGSDIRLKSERNMFCHLREAGPTEKYEGGGNHSTTVYAAHPEAATMEKGVVMTYSKTSFTPCLTAQFRVLHHY